MSQSFEPTLDINARLEVHDLSQEFPTICRAWDENTCHEVAQLTGCQKMSRETLEAYGHRIVACYNACRGFSLEKLREIALQNAEFEQQDKVTFTTYANITGQSELLPCPFCGSRNIDPKGWASNGGKHGPACDNCGASADSDVGWNLRLLTVPSAIASLQAAGYTVIPPQENRHAHPPPPPDHVMIYPPIVVQKEQDTQRAGSGESKGL